MEKLTLKEIQDKLIDKTISQSIFYHLDNKEITINQIAGRIIDITELHNKYIIFINDETFAIGVSYNVILKLIENSQVLLDSKNMNILYIISNK